MSSDAGKTIMMKKNVYLLANAHLDPVWLWDREEGIAEALSTFRVAADFCEQEKHFVFNHNEALLYQWVEEFEPELFQRIQKLVEEGKWHIMGGWFIQPDCNMPSGESFIRQIREGRRYFQEKFHKEPHTAINFDPFGHTKGLVQILAKSGYDSYLFMRPGKESLTLPGEDFIWRGFDGSSVHAHRLTGGYNTLKGHAAEKLDQMLKDFPEKEQLLVLWGVGNHGGGPSRIDLDSLNERIKTVQGWKIKHATPEEYFSTMIESGKDLPDFDKSLELWAPGCYSSQVRIKQLHRRLENELYMTEKMAAAAWLQQKMDYPENEFRESEKDLLFCEFHDILPGSSIQDVEEAGIRIINHGLEILSRIRTKAFFRLCAGQKKGSGSCIPILVYNPHPYPVEQPVYCEFQLEDQNWEENFTLPVVKKDNIKVPSQAVKEKSNINLDWRKQVVFLAKLEPYQMSRFDCELVRIPFKPAPEIKVKDGKYHAGNDNLQVVIDAESGMLEEYIYNGISYIGNNHPSELAVLKDNEDPWAMRQTSFTVPCGSFIPMSPEEAGDFSGIDASTLNPVHVTEDGEVETVIEAFLKYSNSRAVISYHIPKAGGVLHINLRVFWNEGKKMLKLMFPTEITNGIYLGQTAFGADTLRQDGTECVSGKWNGLFDVTADRALAVITGGTYASSCDKNTIALTILRSPCYSAHPILERPILPQDRFSPRIDQGERIFDFWIMGGKNSDIRIKIEREALIRNEKPVALSFYPSGEGIGNGKLFSISNPAVLLTACFKSGEGVIIRLYNSTESKQNTVIDFPDFNIKKEIRLDRYEVKTFYAGREGIWEERGMLNC